MARIVPIRELHGQVSRQSWGSAWSEDLAFTIEALTSALERTEQNFRAAVNGHPVRDMTENLADNAYAMGVDR